MTQSQKLNSGQGTYYVNGQPVFKSKADKSKSVSPVHGKLRIAAPRESINEFCLSFPRMSFLTILGGAVDIGEDLFREC